MTHDKPLIVLQNKIAIETKSDSGCCIVANNRRYPNAQLILASEIS
jgi:hypothetical protein